MDETLTRLDVGFIPNDNSTSNKPVPSFTTFLREYYQQHYDPRGGYGQPLPGNFDRPQTEALFEKRWLDVIESAHGRQRWDASLGPIGPNCTHLIQLGPSGTAMGVDGTKWICSRHSDAENASAGVAEQRVDEEASGCDIISIGGNDNWKFKSAVRSQLGCTTHTFDCTLPNNGLPRRKPADDRIRFYQSCVGATTYNDTHGRRYLSYHDLLLEAGLSRPPTLFKMDVEGFEFDIFLSMIQGPAYWLPQQISVELHWATRMTGLEWMPRTRTSAEIALLMSAMFLRGYLPIMADFSPGCKPCMEVVFFRAACPAS